MSRMTLFQSMGDWASLSEDPTPAVVEEPQAPAPAKNPWGAPKAAEAAPVVDLRKIQEDESKKKKPAPASASQAYKPPTRDNSNQGGYEQRGGYESRGYNNEQRGGYESRGYNNEQRGGYQPREQRGGYEPRGLNNEQRGYDQPREFKPREEFPVPDVPPFTARAGNLNFSMTDEYFAGYFEELGVVSATIFRESDTGKSKGFGIIEFKTKEGLENALLCNNSEELFMDRPFQISVHSSAGKRSGADRDSWLDKPPKPEYGSGFGASNRGGYGSYGNRGGPGSYGRNNFDRDRPTGPPKIVLAPASGTTRDASPPKKNLSEDPFGGVALNEDKLKQIQQDRENRQREKEEQRKNEIEQQRLKQEQEKAERIAQQAEERRKREEAFQLKRQQELDSWKDKKKETPVESAADAKKTWKNDKDTSWGPKNPPTEGAETQEKKPKENAWGKKDNQFRGGVGRGTPESKEAGRGRGGRGGPKPEGRGRGGDGPKYESRSKADGQAARGKSPVKPPADQPKAQPTDSTAVAPKEAKKPFSYKAALGGGPSQADKKATQNPFQALQNDEAEL